MRDTLKILALAGAGAAGGDLFVSDALPGLLNMDPGRLALIAICAIAGPMLELARCCARGKIAAARDPASPPDPEGPAA